MNLTILKLHTLTQESLRYGETLTLASLGTCMFEQPKYAKVLFFKCAVEIPDYLLITSLAKEVMFWVVLVCLFVCLSVCLFVDNITQKVMNGLG